MYEVAQDFYEKVIPEAREIIARAASRGQVAQAKAAGAVLEEILARPEHAWYLEEKAKEKGSSERARRRASSTAGEPAGLRALARPPGTGSPVLVSPASLP